MELTIEQALNEGIRAQKQNRLEEAEKVYRAILAVNPSHPDANHNLGLILTSFGKFEEAIPFFRNAVASDHRVEQFWVSLLDALIKIGKIYAARELLAQATKLGLVGEKISSIAQKLHPSTNLDFFYSYLEELGVFTSQEGELLNGDLKPIPLLTNSFLNWYETQKWNSLSLLEFGSGGSTLYFSKFFSSITSFETNQDWFDNLVAKIPENVTLMKVDSIISSLKKNSIKDIHSFDVILIDAGENRAKLARWLIDKNYKGIVFFDNSEWYRQSVGMFIESGFLEIPFFGIKPIEDWVSCTSVVAEPSALRKIFDGNWSSFPKMTWHEKRNNSWDNENS